jgi:hypothetical protein
VGVPIGVIDVRLALLYHVTDSHRQAGPSQRIIGWRRVLRCADDLRSYGSRLRECRQFNAVPWVLQYDAANVEPSDEAFATATLEERKKNR